MVKKVEEEEARMVYRKEETIKKSREKMNTLRRKAKGNTTEELRTWRGVKH